MSYSPALSYFLDRLQGYSTNVFRLEAQGSNSASASKIIRFTLPSNALLNLRSFALHFNATTAGTTAGARLPAKIDTLVDRVEVTAGGVQLSAGANFYNVLRHAKDALMGDSCCPVLGHPEIVRAESYVDSSAIATTGNETYASTNNSAQFAIQKWEGFLGTCEPKILDSSLVPDLVVSIYLSDNSVLTSSAGVGLDGAGTTDITDDGAGGASYSLANIHATIECLGLAGSTYNNMVAGMIASQGFLELPFKQYFSFQDTVTNTMRFTVATQSLDRIWVAHRQDAFGTQAAPVRVSGYVKHDATTTTGVAEFEGLEYNKEKYVGPFYNFAEPPTTSKILYQFQLNGAYYPQFKATFEEMYNISGNSVLGKPGHKHSLQTMKDNYSVQCIRLNMPESEFSRLVSGLDTRAVSLNGYYVMDNVSQGRTVNLFAECTSSLKIGAGRMIETVQ